ncbi:MAG TPA: glycosyltransferase [Candidatus Tenderia sp.]|nr:glycosyltransferase [Candidatus Tenderia sp.]
MNILQINTRDLVGGAARVMYRLHLEFQRRGHTSHMLVRSRSSPNPQVQTITAAVGRRGRWQRLERAISARADARLGTPRLHRSTKRILRTAQFQQAHVVNLHNLHGRYFNYHLLPALTAMKPTVWTLHDMWALTGHCAYAYDCERWKTGCSACPLLRGSGRQIVEPSATWLDRTFSIWRAKKRLYQRTKVHIVTPSYWLRDLVEESILSHALSIQCIPNGVDLDTFVPIEQHLARYTLGLPTNGRVVLFVAEKVAAKRKGATYLLEALSRLPDAASIILLTMGAGDVLSQKPLHRFRLRNVGRLYDERLQSVLYSAADLFVFPSLADNQPLVLIESLACGTPIVAFDTGGVSEMVRPGETGYLARSRDVDDLAHGIHTLLTHDDLRAKMRRRCREIAEKEYSLSLQADRYLALYEQVIGEQHVTDHTP